MRHNCQTIWVGGVYPASVEAVAVAIKKPKRIAEPKPAKVRAKPYVKDVVIDFLRLNGPSTYSTICASTGICKPSVETAMLKLSVNGFVTCSTECTEKRGWWRTKHWRLK